MATGGPLEEILDLARWAPSGDNTQPWRFEPVGESSVVVHGFDTRDHCVYDLDGRPSQISLGALLETMAIAATAHGLRMEARRRPATDERRLVFDVSFYGDPTVVAHPLIASVKRRSVQRRPMKMRGLTADERKTLEAAVGAGYRVAWMAGWRERLSIARLLFRFARLRLTMPEAYEVHRNIIEWNARYSEDRVPDQALGLDPLTVYLMRFVMRSWSRVSFFNRFLAGTWIPRIQMDLIPGFACAAHFLIVANQPPTTVDDYLRAGRAMQRFWLTVTQLGLTMQPELTPIIFSRYVRNGIAFSKDQRSQSLARKLSWQLRALVDREADSAAVFMGRVGAGPEPFARSTRRPLPDLIVRREPTIS